MNQVLSDGELRAMAYCSAIIMTLLNNKIIDEKQYRDIHDLAHRLYQRKLYELRKKEDGKNES